LVIEKGGKWYMAAELDVAGGLAVVLDEAPRHF
jgi:hypothetical protein